MSDDSVDALALTAALIREVERAWDALKSRTADERIYSFALYTCAEWSCLLATGSTEESLTRAVARCVEAHPEDTDARHEEALRWSYADSEYHSRLPDLADSQGFLLVSGEEALESLSDKSFDEYCHQVRACCVEALRVLDGRLVFGRGEDRERLVINVAMGDMSEEEWEAGLEEMNHPATCQRYSRLAVVKRQAGARTEPMSVEEQATYWVAQYTESAERDLWFPHRTSDGFDRSDVEKALVELGESAVPCIVREVERCVCESETFRELSEREHGPMTASPAARAFNIMWLLGRIGITDDNLIERLVAVLRRLVERDQEREWTETSSENLARTLHALRPNRFPESVLDPRTNHLRNPSAFLD